MLKILESTRKLDSYMEMEFFNDDTKERVKDADIILLPDFGIKVGVDRTFQPDTIAFYKFSTINNHNDLKIELFENKGEEQILALHSFDIWVPFMYIANSVLFPIVINIVSNYVYDRMKGRPNDKPTIHFNLLVENKEKGVSKQLFYKGPVDGFKENFEKIDVNKLWEE